MHKTTLDFSKTKWKQRKAILENHGAQALRETLLHDLQQNNSYLQQEKQRLKKWLFALQQDERYRHRKAMSQFIRDNVKTRNCNLNPNVIFLRPLHPPTFPFYINFLICIISKINALWARITSQITDEEFVRFNEDWRQLHKFYDSPECFRIITTRSYSKTLKRTIAAIIHDTQQTSFTEAMLRNQKRFPRWYSRWLALGTKLPYMDQVPHIIEFLVFSEQYKRNIVAALSVPIYTITTIYAILSCLAIAFIPQLWFVIPIVPPALFLFYKFMGTMKFLRILRDQFLLDIPILGEMLIKFSQAKYAKSLSLLLGKERFMFEALITATGTIYNTILCEKFRSVYDSIREGEDITEPLQNAEIFTHDFLQTIDHGEQSGELDKVANDIAERYKQHTVPQKLRPRQATRFGFYRFKKTKTTVTLPEFPIEPTPETPQQTIPQIKPPKTKTFSEFPFFEEMLSEEAGRPGPTERLIAQSQYLMKSIQATIGLKFVLLANAIDIFLSTVSSYIHGIFNSWKMLRMAYRKVARSIKSDELVAISKNHVKNRLYLSRLFAFANFDSDEFHNQFQLAKQETFPIELVLNARHNLDEMKRDLSLVTQQQAQEFAKKTFTDFCLSFLPNPTEIVAQCKDWFILCFVMKYSRQQIEEMYANALASSHMLIVHLEKQFLYQGKSFQRIPSYEKKILSYERQLLDRLRTHIPNSTLPKIIQQNRHDLQRLLQMLTNPQQFVDPRYWSIYDLVYSLNQATQKIHPQHAYELDNWLYKEILIGWKKISVKVDCDEKQQLLLFYKKYRFVRWLGAKYIW